MASTPDTDAEHDDALDHVVRGLFDAELERLAFGRPTTDAEARTAAAAVRELDRRAAEHTSRAGLDADTVVVAMPAREAGSRPWWRRVSTIVAASALLLIVSTSIVPLLNASPADSSSLAIFGREPSAEELDLRAQLQREGLRLSATPRVIAERGDTRVVAFRFVTTAPTERSRNEVCVLLIDERVLGLPACVVHATFVRDGLQATLSGASSRFVVTWGPTGTAAVSVLPDVDGSLGQPDSDASEAFFTHHPADDDARYAALLRVLHPDDRLIVRVLSSTPSWNAVGALVASADSGLWSYCVHLFDQVRDERAQVGGSVTCAERRTFERDGLVAQARRTDDMVLLEWKPDDAVFMHEIVGQ